LVANLAMIGEAYLEGHGDLVWWLGEYPNTDAKAEMLWNDLQTADHMVLYSKIVTREIEIIIIISFRFCTIHFCHLYFFFLCWFIDSKRGNYESEQIHKFMQYLRHVNVCRLVS